MKILKCKQVDIWITTFNNKKNDETKTKQIIVVKIVKCKIIWIMLGRLINVFLVPSGVWVIIFYW